MGVGFVILIHLVFLFIISSIVSLFGVIITMLISNKEKKKRKVLLAILIPFHIFFSSYILGLIGSIIISETTNVDIGIGDSWYAPINVSYQILMIDLPEQAYIQYEDESLISDVSEIQQIDQKVFCKTYKEKYYSINLSDKKVTEYQTLNEIMQGEKLRNLNLTKVVDFYEKRKWEVSGIAIIVVGIISLTISILSAIFISLLIMRRIKVEVK